MHHPLSRHHPMMELTQELAVIRSNGSWYARGDSNTRPLTS